MSKRFKLSMFLKDSVKLFDKSQIKSGGKSILITSFPYKTLVLLLTFYYKLYLQVLLQAFLLKHWFY